VRLSTGLRRPALRVHGTDVAGTVETVGGNVTRLRPGDEVFGNCHGAFAEYALGKEDRLLSKPAGLTFEQAAAVPVSGYTALQALRDRGHVVPGHKVLVIGAGGGVGAFAVQIAKALGAEVTGVCSTSKVDLVRSIGAGKVIDYTRDDFTRDALRYDVIIDTAGNRPLLRVRRALTPRGTLVLVGGEGGGRWLGGMDRVLRAAMLSRSGSRKVQWMLARARLDDLRFLRELIEAGKVVPVVDRTWPLREAAEAIRYLARGSARGKVVLTV